MYRALWQTISRIFPAFSTLSGENRKDADRLCFSSSIYVLNEHWVILAEIVLVVNPAPLLTGKFPSEPKVALDLARLLLKRNTDVLKERECFRL